MPGRDRRGLGHRPDRARHDRLPGADAHLARGPRRRVHRLPDPDVHRGRGARVEPSRQQVDVEAVQAHLPVAREPLRLRARLHAGPRREHRARSVRRRRGPRRADPRPLDLPERASRHRDARPVRLPHHGADRPVHEGPAGRHVAPDPSPEHPGVGTLLGPRDPGRHGQRKRRLVVRGQRPGDRRRGRISLLGVAQGSADVCQQPAGVGWWTARCRCGRPSPAGGSGG